MPKMIEKLNADGTPELDTEGNPIMVEAPEDKRALTDAEIDKLVNDAADLKLKPVKDNLDKAYKERDDYKKKVDAQTEKDRAAELKRLEEEGKHKEAYEMRLKEKDERIAALEHDNVGLTRDISVRAVLSAHPFKSPKALEMAYSDLVKDFIRDAEGKWINRDGTSIEATVKRYLENDENTFLLKPKTNSGGGQSKTDGSGDNTKQKSIFDMTQAEVMALAAEGKLRK